MDPAGVRRLPEAVAKQRDVLPGGEGGQQVEALKHKADVFGAVPGTIAYFAARRAARVQLLAS
jgi:hypothetical protein